MVSAEDLIFQAGVLQGLLGDQKMEMQITVSSEALNRLDEDVFEIMDRYNVHFQERADD